MKAVLVKSNEFKTVGLEIKASDRVVFSWGISPGLKSNFQKELDCDMWMVDLIDLISIQARLRERRFFRGAFFDTARLNGMHQKDDKGVDFSVYDEYTEVLMDKFNKIINKLL